MSNSMVSSKPGCVITISPSLLKLTSTESVMPSSHLLLCHPLLLLPSIFPSIRVFSNESVLRIRWPKYFSFSFSISPSNEYSGLILFRIDWFDLLAIQGTLKSVFQYHSLKASILQHSAFFMVQLSHPYMATGKTIALTGHPSWLSGKEPACQCKRHRFDPWVSEFPWRRKWQPTPVFFPGNTMEEEPGRL